MKSSSGSHRWTKALHNCIAGRDPTTGRRRDLPTLAQWISFFRAQQSSSDEHLPRHRHCGGDYCFSVLPVPLLNEIAQHWRHAARLDAVQHLFVDVYHPGATVELNCATPQFFTGVAPTAKEAATPPPLFATEDPLEELLIWWSAHALLATLQSHRTSSSTTMATTADAARLLVSCLEETICPLLDFFTRPPLSPHHYATGATTALVPVPLPVGLTVVQKIYIAHAILALLLSSAAMPVRKRGEMGRSTSTPAPSEQDSWGALLHPCLRDLQAGLQNAAKRCGSGSEGSDRIAGDWAAAIKRFEWARQQYAPQSPAAAPSPWEAIEPPHRSMPVLPAACRAWLSVDRACLPATCPSFASPFCKLRHGSRAADPAHSRGSEEDTMVEMLNQKLTEIARGAAASTHGCSSNPG